MNEGVLNSSCLHSREVWVITLKGFITMIKKIICSLILGSASLTSLQADTITDTRIAKATGRLENLASYVKSTPERLLQALNGTSGGSGPAERATVGNPASFLANKIETGGPLACQYEGKDATVTPILSDVDFAALKAATDKSADNKAVVDYPKGSQTPTHSLVVWGEKALGKKDLICYIPVVRN